MERVAEFISGWKSSYKHHLQMREDDTDEHVESKGGHGREQVVHGKFSKPTQRNPVASVVVNVTFRVQEDDTVAYTIEYESQVHKSTDKVPFHESWLDRVANTKSLITDEYKSMLTTPYETSRLGFDSAVDTKFVDDLQTKALSKDEEKDWDPEAKRPSQRKTDDRAPSDREQMLENIQQFELELIRRFKDADDDGNGVLDSTEFYEIVRYCGVGISDADIALLMSEADENSDGKVDYNEFVPIAVELLQVMTNGQFAVYEAAERESYIKDEELKEMYSSELAHTLHEIQRRIDQTNPEAKLTGKLSRSDLRKCLGGRRNGLLREEINMCMGMIQVDVHDHHMVLIDGLPDVIVDVRLTSVRSMIQRKLASRLELYLLNQCERFDQRVHQSDCPTGYLTLMQLRDVLLFHTPQVVISRIQAYGIVAEAREDPETKLVEYREFVNIAAFIIDQMFDPKALKEKHELTRRADIQPIELLGGRDKTQLEGELKELFLRHDDNENGTLDQEEFVECIEALKLNLPNNYMASLLIAADEDGSGDVDYEEFIEFAYDYLLHLVRERAIQEIKESIEQSAKPTLSRSLSANVSTRLITLHHDGV